MDPNPLEYRLESKYAQILHDQLFVEAPDSEGLWRAQAFFDCFFWRFEVPLLYNGPVLLNGYRPVCVYDPQNGSMWRKIALPPLHRELPCECKDISLNRHAIQHNLFRLINQL